MYLFWKKWYITNVLKFFGKIIFLLKFLFINEKIFFYYPYLANQAWIILRYFLLKEKKRAEERQEKKKNF